MKTTILLLLTLPVVTFAKADRKSSELTERVSRMARIGSVSASSFSPDGRWLSVISNVSGLPQVYTIPVEGGWPRMITDGVDPVVSAVWSPAPGSNWLAITVAPGGGLNTQVYVVRSDGTGLRRLTDGGQDNDAFNAWSHDGTSGVHPLPGRGSWLAEDTEPDQIDGRDGAVLRRAFELPSAERWEALTSRPR
jgi:hypothetical protein